MLERGFHRHCLKVVMENSFDFDRLQQKITDMSRAAGFMFLLSCAERLLANYEAFVRRHHWGDVEALEDALELSWKTVTNGNVERQRLESQMVCCKRAMPDTEDFDSEYVSPALDAAVCCILALEVAIEYSVSKIVEGASLARDTVDMYIQELEMLDPQNPMLEDKISHHPLMQRELKTQNDTIELLKSKDGTAELWMLADVLRSPAVSNIGLSRDMRGR